MANKGIDSNGLLYVLQRIKANFALKSHTHQTSDINSGNIVTGIKGNSETNYRTGQVNLTAANVGAAASSHAHGNIASDGTLQTTDVPIADGDKLVVSDASNSGKAARASAAFDGFDAEIDHQTGVVITDGYQEKNGIYAFDRRIKFDLDKLHAIMSRKAAIEK